MKRTQETLMKLVAFQNREASDWAYPASEVINWEMDAAGY